MEKGNMYPEMPAYQGMPDAPPNYNQAFPPTAPSVAMPSAGPGQFDMQPQQQPMNIQTNIPSIPPLGPNPCRVTCPSCHHQQMTTIKPEAATKTHLFAALLCVVGLCCCACIPYCVDTCKNANHYCSNCDAYLGTYNK